MVDLSRFIVTAVFFALVFAYGLRWMLFQILRSAGLLRRKDVPAETRIRRGFRLTVLAVGALGLACIGWGFIEPYFPVVERVQIVSDKIAAPIRIVQISDLHCDLKVRAEEKVIRRIASLKPDLIVFTGDGVNSDEGIPLFKRTMRTLSKLAPCEERP